MGFEGSSLLRVTCKNGFNSNSSFPGYDVYVMDFVLSYFFTLLSLINLAQLSLLC